MYLVSELFPWPWEEGDLVLAAEVLEFEELINRELRKCSTRVSV